MAGALRRRRAGALFGIGMVVAVAMVAAGVVLTVSGYRADNGPGGAVRGYFTALARGKARTALAYGGVPGGTRKLLTFSVLHRQLQVAPVRDFAIEGVTRTGETAQVQVRYELGFAGAPQKVTSTVPVTHRSGHWRLTAVAVPTLLRTATAQQRVVTFGPPPASGRWLVFPGALPLAFDTKLLTLDPATDHVEFGHPEQTAAVVDASAEGTEQARDTVLANLRACLAGRGTTTCPQPTERYVPGSLRGTLVSGSSALSVSVTGAAGVLTVSGTLTVNGTYQRLTFSNRPVDGSGQVALPVAAQSYAVTPLRFVWGES